MAEGWIGKAMDFIGERLSAIPAEAGQMLDHKIAQGAAELSQALNSQADGYVPYGVGQAPLEVEGPAMSYQDMLKDAAQRAPDQGMDRGMEI